MIVALAILIVCSSMLLVYAILCTTERHLKHRENGGLPSQRDSKIN